MIISDLIEMAISLRDRHFLLFIFVRTVCIGFNEGIIVFFLKMLCRARNRNILTYRNVGD